MNPVVSQFNKAIRDGSIIRGSCEVCGKPNADGHHDDYSKPLSVRWLCRTHHLKEHANIRKIKGIKIIKKRRERRLSSLSNIAIRALMDNLDYSESDLASKIGVSEITIRRWLNAENKPQGAAAKTLKRMIQKSIRSNAVQTQS